jgi:flagellar L-ring protein precursor FlgH
MMTIGRDRPKLSWQNHGLRLMLAMSLAGILGACTPKLPPPPPWQPVPTAAQPSKPLSEGSLWRETPAIGDLFADLRARKVGDVVTVQILENAEALKSASTQTSRDSSMGASVDSLFGKPWTASLNSLYGTGRPWKPEMSGSMKNDFKGSGTTQRKDTLVATMTAKVVEVLPGGLLRIEGYRDVMINNERQYILLRGVIRPVDILSNNVVLSTAVADAQIAYSGYGVVSDKQRPGWLSRALDYVWPF